MVAAPAYSASRIQSRLPGDELRRRALGVRLVLTDCDGVLTDAGVYYSSQGEQLKRFSVRDGMGVERLRLHGIETAIITRENCPCVKKRAEKLKLRYVFLGIPDKEAYLPVILGRTGLAMDQLAYIGDDVNDLPIIENINESGLTGAPLDAVGQVADVVQYRAAAPGGHGAFRDFAEWIINLRDVY
ncbi:MAG TPA: 3-deoxy-D-manno-octulosonate 8-phosphate phosphatase [Blastocatellia bacterium]|nr:3-deoxy-D-manno-octulosonate 8-phosphate phosphatase [Blastocatellia bacterium]